MEKKEYKTPLAISKYASKIRKKEYKSKQAPQNETSTVEKVSGNTPGVLKKAKIKSDHTSSVIKKMGREKTVNQSLISGGFEDIKLELKRAKREYDKYFHSGDSKKTAHYKNKYNKLLKKAKGYASKNKRTLIKSEGLRKKYKPKINRAMKIDEVIQGLDND